MMLIRVCCTKRWYNLWKFVVCSMWFERAWVGHDGRWHTIEQILRYRSIFWIHLSCVEIVLSLFRLRRIFSVNHLGGSTAVTNFCLDFLFLFSHVANAIDTNWCDKKSSSQQISFFVFSSSSSWFGIYCWINAHFCVVTTHANSFDSTAPFSNGAYKCLHKICLLVYFFARFVLCLYLMHLILLIWKAFFQMWIELNWCLLSVYHFHGKSLNNAIKRCQYSII